MPLQPKLLRFLQERRYERVGEARPRSADVRLIAATNRDLDAAVAAGQFREDLLFRLNVVELALPPLRERTDRSALAEHLLAFFARQLGKKIEGFSPEAREALSRYGWPGNLRELRNAMERAAIFATGHLLDVADLPDRIIAAASRSSAGIPGDDRGRRAGDPRTARGRTYPLDPGPDAQPRGRRAHPRNRSQHALSQAQAARILIDDR